MSALKPVDARAGRLCSHCNLTRPADPALVEHHCENRRCGWWRCPRCKAWNDRQGRNDKTDLAGRSKDGSKR